MNDSKMLWNEPIAQANLPKGFFGYPSSPPSIPPTIMAAIEAINRSNNAIIRSWEELQISGHYVIREICAAIDEADFFCADVTNINPNVLFELGYAIATDKRVWLIRDSSYEDTKKEFDQLKLLTTVGYSPYTNSNDIIREFFSQNPHLTLDDTIWRQSIEPVLEKQTVPNKAVLYLKNQHETEASIQVSRTLENSRVPLTISDPRETSIRPAYWYAQQLWDALGALVHFSSSSKEGFRIHNARYALIAGMARGFSIPTLMLSEQGDLLAPIDYRDSMNHYTTPKEAATLVDDWLLPIRKEENVVANMQASRVKALRLATELKDFHLQLGDYIAEDDVLLNEYFVETTVSTDIINGTQSVFVGRKGTGKTANLLHAEATLGSDTQSLVCLIKPVGYEIEGLVRLFSKYKVRDYKGYVIESLWKFMIYTELARAAVSQIKNNAIWKMTEQNSKELVNLLEDETKAFSGDFAVRLERMVELLTILPPEESGEDFRKGISETLHSGALARLRLVLGKVLSEKRKVVLLVDNLDKSWTKHSDLTQLAEFLLGLLTAANRVGEELNRAERDREASRFSSAIFLRSDIFEKVLEATREPDKLSFTRLKWDDDELLLRVIEERYVASHGENSEPSTMWHQYFCPQVNGIPTREYIVSRILKRPRDIVYLVKASVSFAVNRKHDRVEEKDILDGEEEYSQYALDSILVENGISIPELEDVLFQFGGGDSIVTETQARQIISKKLDIDRVDYAISHLVRLSFLGLEIAHNTFLYAEENRELKLNQVLSDRYCGSNERRYQINKPFRAYLQIAN